MLVALAVACGPRPAREVGSPPPALPAGYELYDGGKLGFRFGLAPADPAQECESWYEGPYAEA